MAEQTRFDLSQDQMPTAWFNIMPSIVQAGMQPLPPLHPGTHEPVGPADLAPLFPESLILQEVSTEPWIDIPGEVLDIYRLWRPSPLHRATRLEQALQTPGAHLLQVRGRLAGGLAQAEHRRRAGLLQQGGRHEADRHRDRRRAVGLRARDGVRVLRDRLPGLHGQGLLRAEAVPAHLHGDLRRRGDRVALADDAGGQGRRWRATPTHTGSLGLAISEAVEVVATSGGSIKYALGSVLNHVLLHQTVIGLEAKAQMEMAGDTPDVVIGCVGGGSNYAGIAYPFMADRLSGAKPNLRFLATEPAACPTLTKGRFAYDFGDTAGMSPIVPMYTLGHTFVPAPVHAGGLRYHGDSPSLSMLVHEGHMEAAAYTQNQVFEAAIQFAKTQGIVAAPESAHAIKGAIDEAIAAREANEERVILFNLSGHGAYDMQAYDDYLNGRLPEIEFDPSAEDAALAELPDVPPIG